MAGDAVRDSEMLHGETVHASPDFLQLTSLASSPRITRIEANGTGRFELKTAIADFESRPWLPR